MAVRLMLTGAAPLKMPTMSLLLRGAEDAGPALSSPAALAALMAFDDPLISIRDKMLPSLTRCATGGKPETTLRSGTDVEVQGGARAKTANGTVVHDAYNTGERTGFRTAMPLHRFRKHGFFE